MKIREFLDFLTDGGLTLGAADRFCFGDPERTLTGITVAFTATLEAIEHAKEGDLLIVRERIFFPTAYSGGKLDNHLCDRINLPRIEALIRKGLTVLQLSDALELPFLRRAIETRLGLPPAQSMDAVYTIPETSLEAFCSLVSEKLGLDWLRVTGEEKQISSIGLVNGGAGITRSKTCLVEELTRHLDLLLCGETDEYPQWAALDSGIVMLQTGQVAFDHLGLEEFSRWLSTKLPTITVAFYPIEVPFTIV